MPAIAWSVLAALAISCGGAPPGSDWFEELRSGDETSLLVEAQVDTRKLELNHETRNAIRAGAQPLQTLPWTPTSNSQVER